MKLLIGFKIDPADCTWIIGKIFEIPSPFKEAASLGFDNDFDFFMSASTKIDNDHNFSISQVGDTFQIDPDEYLVFVSAVKEYNRGLPNSDSEYSMVE